MIITSMTTKEIIAAFKADYPEIRRRMESYICHNKKLFIQRLKKEGKKVDTIILQKPRETVISGNRYYIYLTVTHDLSGCIQFVTLPYLFVMGSHSGTPRCFIRIFDPECLIEIKPRFLRKYCPGLSFIDGLDYYIRNSGLMSSRSITFMDSKVESDRAYNMYVDLGDDRAGVGYITDSDQRVILSDLYTREELEDIAESLGLEDDLNPVQVLDALKKSEEEIKSEPGITELDIESEEERKKREIELSWAEYGY